MARHSAGQATPTLTFGNGSTMTFGQLTDCLLGRNRDDVWCMCKLPPSTGCPPTVDELSEGILRRLDYAIRERSQDPYDIEILWCVEEGCYVVMACTDSEAHENG